MWKCPLNSGGVTIAYKRVQPSLTGAQIVRGAVIA
jgi:hypothetical protein